MLVKVTQLQGERPTEALKSGFRQRLASDPGVDMMDTDT